MIDETLTIEPRPAPSIRRRRPGNSGRRRSGSRPGRSPSRRRVNASAGRIRLMPALLTRIVASPSRSATADRRRVDGGGRADVERNARMVGPERRRDLVGHGAVVVRHGDTRAGAGERRCDRGADPVPGAGDDGDFICERGRHRRSSASPSRRRSTTVWPVMNEEASLARKTTRLPMSCGRAAALDALLIERPLVVALGIGMDLLGVRRERARGDRVDRDAVRADLMRQRPGEADDRTLRRDVVEQHARSRS